MISKQETEQWKLYFSFKEKGREKIANIILDGIMAKWYTKNYSAESIKNLAQSL